jgi:uncharacterized RDD family membrane protein YckC
VTPLDEAKQELAQAAAIRHRRAERQPAAATRAPAVDEQVGEQYAGLVTRTIAFAVDSAVVNGVALLVAIAVGLGVAVLHIPAQAEALIGAVGGVVWVLWSIGYFTFFWSSTGVTPGSRLMRIHVIAEHGGRPLRPLRAAARFGFLILAALPLGAGLLMMIWDERARCLQDRMTRTVVVFAAAEET